MLLLHKKRRFISQADYFEQHKVNVLTSLKWQPIDLKSHSTSISSHSSAWCFVISFRGISVDLQYSQVRRTSWQLSFICFCTDDEQKDKSILLRDMFENLIEGWVIERDFHKNDNGLKLDTNLISHYWYAYSYNCGYIGRPYDIITSQCCMVMYASSG